MTKMVEFKGVDLAYGKNRVLNNLNLHIHKGDFIGIVGPNGSGKTTVIRSIMGLIKPVNGEIKRIGDISFGYSIQRQFVDTIFPFTVFDIVMMSRTRIIGPLKKPSSHDKEEVNNALETTGVLHLRGKTFKNLSGGEKQRVLLARALAAMPDFLILDEPTADLDIKAEREILDLIKLLHEEKNITVIIITHELNEIINRAKKFIFLNKGRSSKIFQADELNGSILSSIFGIEIKLVKSDGKLIII